MRSSGTVLLRRVPPRRRREGLTNYRKRLKLVKSGLPRLVIRRTNRYIIVQLTYSVAGGDKTVATVTSKDLLKHGWRDGLKNTPAAYLTGILAGVKAKKLGITKLVADLGLFPRSSRLYAVIKGVLDVGVEVPASEEVLPPEERLRGEHIKAYFDDISQQPERKTFTKVDREAYARLSEHVEEVKQRLLSEAEQA